MKQLFVYLDPNYNEEFGHYKNVQQSIRDAVCKLDIDYWHIGNTAHTSLEQSDRPHFAYQHPSSLFVSEDIPKTLSDFDSITNSVLTFLTTSNQYQKVTVFLYTTHPLHLPILARLASAHAKFPIDLKIYSNVLYLDNQHYYEKIGYENEKELFEDVSAQVELYDLKKQLIVCVDSKRSILKYQKYFKRALSLIPVPILNDNIAVEPVVSDYIRIGYPGRASLRNGYDLVLYTYEKLEKSETFNKVWFNIRHAPTGADTNLVKRFASKENNISHFRGYFNSEREYYDFLNQSDIVLIPYRRNYYETQTSGLILEAIFLNKVVITTKDTWMADILLEYGSGLVTESEDTDGIMKAIEVVVDSYQSYKNKAMSIDRTVFARTFSGHNLIQTLGL